MGEGYLLRSPLPATTFTPASETLGALLAWRRKRLGKTQRQLAYQLSLSENTIRGYERGYREPSLDRLMGVLAVLNCAVTIWPDGNMTLMPLEEEETR